MSSNLPKDNIDELKRIVNLYNQEIEFIISDNIVPEWLKKVMINTNNLTWWVRYRRFFPNFIKWIDRILCIDCDVLVMKDISEIYNMDMHWKSIAWYYEPEPSKTIREWYFWIKNYINNGVLLFDVKKYNAQKINEETINELNKKYSRYREWSDQDKTNIIFNDDIFVYKKWMNYIVERPFFNKWIEDAEILHVLTKPYFEYSLAPKKVCDLYDYYLSKTKWKGYPKSKKVAPILGYIYNCSYRLIFLFLNKIFWIKVASAYGRFHKEASLKIYSFIKKILW